MKALWRTKSNRQWELNSGTDDEEKEEEEDDDDDGVDMMMIMITMAKNTLNHG